MCSAGSTGVVPVTCHLQLPALARDPVTQRLGWRTSISTKPRARSQQHHATSFLKGDAVESVVLQQEKLRPIAPGGSPAAGSGRGGVHEVRGSPREVQGPHREAQAPGPGRGRGLPPLPVRRRAVACTASTGLGGSSLPVCKRHRGLDKTPICRSGKLLVATPTLYLTISTPFESGG